MASEQAADVHLLRLDNYREGELSRAAAQCLDTVMTDPPREGTVLIKPNFISKQNPWLSCTRPEVIRAVCAYFASRGNRVLVGDSPAFGSARAVAGRLALAEMLGPYEAEIVELGSRGRPAGRAPRAPAMAALPEPVDLVINLAKLKAHKQMAISSCCKNLFGFVPGARKAVAHARHGGSRREFASMILRILSACPPGISMIDGVQAMHKSGPVDGEPFDLGLLGASSLAIALDTAVYLALGLDPEEVPLWEAARQQGLFGADPQEIVLTGERPESFPSAAFQQPATLKPISFHPARLARSLCTRALARLGPER